MLGNAKTTTQQSIESKIKLHSPLVKKIAYHLLSRLPSTVQLEDLLQVGMMGLIEAIERYDEQKAACFDTFAGIRIRGAMLDELRRTNWMPRSVHQHMRQISEAIKVVENRTGRSAHTEEIAGQLNMTIDQYHQFAQSAVAADLVSIDELTDDSIPTTRESDNPSAQVQKTDMVSHIAQAIQRFPEKEQLVLSLYYNEMLNFKEIGQVLNVTEARVSQLHSQAIARLKSKMKC